MIIVAVDYSDIAKWLDELHDIAAKTPKAIATGLNAFGQSIVDEVAQYVSETTGLGDNEVAMMIQVDWATPDDLNLTIDASEALAATQEADWSRPWDARDQSQFQQQTLLKIETLNDGHDCEVCQEAAAASPYTAEDIQNLQAKWADFQGSTSGPAPGARTNLIHPNAVLEGSRFIGYGHVTEMVRAVFSADAIRAETTVRGFTIGPNHPVLTRRGFVRAHALTEGDELLYDRRCDIPGETSAVTDGSSLHDDFDKVPFVENAFATLESVGEGAQTVVASSNDLHGDAIFCQREVDIVRAAGSLLRVLNPCGVEQFSELGFPFSDVQLTNKSGLRALCTLFTTAFATLCGFMSVYNLRLALSGGHTGPLDQFLFRPRPQRNILFFKQAINDSTADVEAPRDRVNALARFVEGNDVFRWDRVVAISHVQFSGRAFDASTTTGLYNSDGYVVKNCRCQVVPFQSIGGMPSPTTGQSRTPPDLFNTRNLAQIVMNAYKLELKIK